MAKNINQAVGLTSYFITLPPARYLMLAIVLLGLVFGFLIDSSLYGRPDFIQRALLDGLMLLSIPALLSAFVVKLMSMKMPFRRIAATALGGEFVYAIAYSFSLLLSGVNPFWGQLVLLVGAALVFVFWYVIARFIFIFKYRSILFAILQLLFYLVFLLSNQALTAPPGQFIDIAFRYYISAFILLISLVIFFTIINAPMKKNLGVSSTDAASFFFSQWLYHNKDMERALEQVGEPAKTLVHVMGFKRENDIVYFVTPYVHYGPFGNLGGSEFSHKIAQAMKEAYGSESFVFHGTVTHDLNPVSSSEMDTIMGSIDSIIKGARFNDGKVSLSAGVHEECKAQALVINDSALIGLSRAPLVTEDINFGLGLAMMSEAEKSVKNAMVVDQHNAETGEITSFDPGSVVGFNYMEAIKDSLGKCGSKKPLKLGIATRESSSPMIGGGGIKVAIFSSSPEYALVLIDSNGVTPQFRDKVESNVKAIGKSLKRDFAVGVFTTDTHQTNIVRGVVNPLKDEEAILESIKDAVKEAAADIKGAQFFSDKRWFDINVLGARQSIEIISTVNSIVAVAKITLPLIVIGAIITLLAVLTRI